MIEALESIDTLEELEAFAQVLRDPPKGVSAKPVTDTEWGEISRVKITMQANRKDRK